MNQPMTILAGIPDSALEELAKAIEAGWLCTTSPVSSFLAITGENAPRIPELLQSLDSQGFSPAQTACLLRTVVAGRQRDRTLLPDLVVSGPDVPGVPTADTHAVVQSLFQEARGEVVVAGYAFHNGRLHFERLAEQRQRRPNLKVLFHVDVPRRLGDTSTAEEIVQRYSVEFRERHWPWRPAPEVFYDPRALSPDPSTRASLHAKVVVVDRSALLLTSANFTEAAHHRNIEMGILSRNAGLASQVAMYFEGLRQSGALLPLPLQ